VCNRHQNLWHHRTHTREFRTTCAQAENKGKALFTPHTSVNKALPRPDVKTAANTHHTCRSCIIDIVAFAKENTNETFELLKPSNIEAWLHQRLRHEQVKTNKSPTDINIRSRISHTQKPGQLKEEEEKITPGCSTWAYSTGHSWRFTVFSTCVIYFVGPSTTDLCKFSRFNYMYMFVSGNNTANCMGIA